MNAETKAVLTGNPAKLKSGEWGVRIDSHEGGRGDVVRIRTRSGKEWDAVVERVIWKGEMDGNPAALATLMAKEKEEHE